MAVDSSGNDWYAELIDGACFDRGRFGEALRLDNSAGEHVRLPPGVVSGLDDFTIALWVKVSERVNWARIFDFGTGTDNYMFLTPQFAGGADAGRMRFSIRTPSGGEQAITASEEIREDKWTHVAVTLSGTTGRLYLDGRLVGMNESMTIKPSDLGLTTQNYLGRSQYPDPLLKGLLDDFCICARALDEQEIRRLMRSGARR